MAAPGLWFCSLHLCLGGPVLEPLDFTADDIVLLAPSGRDLQHIQVQCLSRLGEVRLSYSSTILVQSEGSAERGHINAVVQN